MYDGWQAFYQLTGAAAAQLIGLLFIVATLTGQRPSRRSEQGRRLFTTPVVVQLALVLLASGLALAPGGEFALTSAVMAAAAGASSVYTSTLAVRLVRAQAVSHWSDRWYYGLLTAAANAALLLASLAALAHLPRAACATGLALLAILLLAVRNAWDLVTWLASRPAPADDKV